VSSGGDFLSTAVDESSSIAFRRVCQVAAVAGSSRLEEMLDWLIPVLMYYFDGPWRSPDDWYEAVQRSFGIDLGLHDIAESLERLLSARTLIRDTYRDEYRLSNVARDETVQRLQDADALETRVSTRWYESVGARIPAMSRAEAWQLLLRYAATVFRAHGADAVQLLKETNGVGAHENTNTALLSDIFDDIGISEDQRLVYSLAIAQFFSSPDPETVEYIVQLADSTFNLMALAIDDVTRNELRARLPELKIFIDTNILFSLLGAHDTALSAASVDLFRVIQQNQLPFKLYCHTRTARELESSLEAATHRLTRQTWSQAVSRALIRLPPHAVRLTGIEMRFHQLNAAQPISPAAFCVRYQSPMTLLADFGIRIFREPEAADTSERMTLRATITDQYEEYLKRHPRRRGARYETFEHDAILWMIAKQHQLPNRKGTLYAGSFVLSSDYLFWKFDRTTLRAEFGSRPVVVLPNALLQALRPFVGVSHQFDDSAFARLFATAEFRGTGGKSYADTVQRVSSYLATFADLWEETALRILTDSMLMNSIAKFEESAPEFQQAIERAIFAENELLIRMRDELLDERDGQLEIAKQALTELRTDPTGSNNVASLLAELVEGLESGKNFSVSNLALFEGDQNVTNVHGGHYQNTDSQILAQGPGAQATGNTVYRQQLEVDVSDSELAVELKTIKEHLLGSANTSTDFEAIAGVQGAIEAIEAKDEVSAVSYLKRLFEFERGVTRSCC
jgi:hypothetical protein